MSAEAVEQRLQLTERAPDRPARAGRVLHAQPRVAHRPREHLLEGVDGSVEPGLEAGAEMRADVEDHGVRTDRLRRVEREPERVDRLAVDLVVRRGEIDEVQRMAHDPDDVGLHAPLAEAGDRLGLVVRRPPHAGRLREHLHALAADLLDPVDRGVDPTAR